MIDLVLGQLWASKTLLSLANFFIVLPGISTGTGNEMCRQ